MYDELDGEQHKITAECIELHRLAEIGKYIEMAFNEKCASFDFISGYTNDGFIINKIISDISELIEWGKKKESEENNL